ncbi:Sporulation integral membrane protein YlbJ [compost metagenome]
MSQVHRKERSLLSTLIFGISAVTLVAAIIYAPGETFQASGQGLTIWWRVVFPALLPFIVLIEIMLASGFAHGVGVLLEPFTRKALGLPGSAGWILPLGITAGYPAAASAAAALYRQGKISAAEAEKIVSTSHFCSPMLIIVVIGTGFLGHPRLGLLLLIVHWISGLAAGITLHLLSPHDRSTALPTKSAEAVTSDQIDPLSSSFGFRTALKEMERARLQDARGFGKMLGDSVSSAVQTLMATGGFILIFAVIIHIINTALPNIIPHSFVAGLMEVHLGTFAIARDILSPAICIAFLGAALGWSGISAFLQVRAILGPAGIGGRNFLIHRIVHGAYAYVLTLLLWKPFTEWLPGTLPAFAAIRETESSGSQYYDINSFFPNLQLVSSWLETQLWLFLLLVIGMLGFSLIWRNRSQQ